MGPKLPSHLFAAPRLVQRFCWVHVAAHGPARRLLGSTVLWLKPLLQNAAAIVPVDAFRIVSVPRIEQSQAPLYNQR